MLGRWHGERKGEAALGPRHPGTMVRATELLGCVPGADYEPCNSCRTLIIIYKLEVKQFAQPGSHKVEGFFFLIFLYLAELGLRGGNQILQLQHLWSSCLTRD